MSRRRGRSRSGARSLATGKVERWVQGGEALVDTEEGKVLVEGALPGEEVRLERIERRGRVARGRLVEVLETSPSRVTPPCDLLNDCGGCPWMRLERGSQAGALEALVRRAIRRLPGAESLRLEVVEGKADLGYRRRARFALEKGELGYRARRSSRLVAVERCIILRPELQRALSRIRSRLASCAGAEGELRLALGADAGVVVVMESPAAQPPAVYRALESLVAEGELVGAALTTRGLPGAATWGDPRERGPGVDGEVLLGTIGGFSQANEEVNRLLVEWVSASADVEGLNVLELYAGHGNISVALAPRARSLTAVELDAAAAEACRDNLRARGLAGRVRSADAGAIASISGPPPDVIVLDPPRAGAHDAIPAILGFAPRRIVYVSCDTSTLARDLQALGEGGYVVVDVRAFDMFAHTGHVETGVLLEPAGALASGPGGR